MQSQSPEIDTIISNCLSFFVEQYSPRHITFPVMINTYSLWRKYAYRQIESHPLFMAEQQKVIFQFYLLSQCHYLKIFIEKVTNRLAHQPSDPTMKKQIESNVPLDDKIIKKYNNGLEMHALHQQLVEDIAQLPYLQHIFPKSKNYQLKEQYYPDIIGLKKQDEVTEKVTNSIVNKGLGIIAEKIFTKTFIIQASTLAIRLNPLSIAASFAFSELISRYRSEKQGQELQSKIAQALENTQKKAAELKGIYDECIGLLGPSLRLGGESRQKFLACVRGVLIQDWLSIEKTQDDDGWEVVQLHDSNQFHSLCFEQTLII